MYTSIVFIEWKRQWISIPWHRHHHWWSKTRRKNPHEAEKKHKQRRTKLSKIGQAKKRRRRRKKKSARRVDIDHFHYSTFIFFIFIFISVAAALSTCLQHLRFVFFFSHPIFFSLSLSLFCVHTSPLLWQILCVCFWSIYCKTSSFSSLPTKAVVIEMCLF